jgi:predicted KAP-like P-loop ATPase
VFKPDQPIESASEDLLGRALFAKSLGEAVLSYKLSTSVVTALYGKWGSGKSSVVNMVIEHVRSLATGLPDNERPIVIRFNPWSYSDQNQLIAQFFRELSVALKRKDYGADAQKVGEQLEVYSEFFKPLALVEPTGLGGLFAVAVSKVLKLVGSATRSWGDLKTKDLAQIRAEIDRLLAKQQRKILIVIDDIDRLNNVEIRQIFQLVKVLGDFPNTIYLLAFDQAIVINALKSVQEGSGSEYLEKIVQIPFELPTISKQEVEQLLFSHLNEIIKDVPESKWDQSYWGNLYQSGLKHFFETIRDVNRFINSMRFGFLMVNDNVNPIDFFAITAFHVFEPTLYVGIRDNKDLFAGVFGSRTLSADPEYEQAKKRCDEILERATVLPKEILNDFLPRIFPKLESIYKNMGYGYEFLEQWRRLGRVCSPDNFDIYFRLSIPKGELSPREIETILSLAGNRDAFADALLKLNEDGRILRFLERMEDYTRETIPAEHIESIIIALMDIGDLFPEGRLGMFETDTPMRILRLFYQLSQRFGDQEKRFEIFSRAIKEARRSLYTVVHEIGVQGQQHGKFTSKDRPEPEADRTVNAEQLQQLEQRACEKIQEWASAGRLKSHLKLVSILYSWKRWCPQGEQEVKNFVREMVADDEGLITFIVSCLSKSFVHGMSDHVARVEWRIHLDSVKEFIPL